MAPHADTQAESRSLLPTIRDVAQAAGVSVGTASKALNGLGQLRQETRQKVLLAAEQLGFRPNSLAQSLTRSRTFTVGLLSTDSYGRFSIPILEGIEHALGIEQINVFLCNAAEDPGRERQHIEALLAKRVDGIIVTARRTDPRPPLDLGRSRVPVLYAYTQVEAPGALCLLPDDQGGGALVAEHLMRLGRRRIAHVSGPEGFEAVRLRRAGLRAALEGHGLPLPAALDLSGPWSEAWGREAAARLLEGGDPPDAIFCGSDQIARGVADALRERGVRVPDDVALVGYDNWDVIAAATRPALTSVDMNLHDLGRTAATELLAAVEGKGETGVRRLPCRLVIRESCGVGGAPA